MVREAWTSFYRASISIGINHREGTAVATGITYDTNNIESLSGLNADLATWAAFFVESVGYGCDPICNQEDAGAGPWYL
jgi:hypothetical protein